MIFRDSVILSMSIAPDGAVYVKMAGKIIKRKSKSERKHIRRTKQAKRK